MGLPTMLQPTLLTCGQALTTRLKACNANPRLWGHHLGQADQEPEQICAYLRMRFLHKSEHEPVRGDDLPVHRLATQRRFLMPRSSSQAPSRILRGVRPRFKRPPCR